MEGVSGVETRCRGLRAEPPGLLFRLNNVHILGAVEGRQAQGASDFTFRAGQPWASHSTPLSPNLHICKMVLMRTPQKAAGSYIIKG